MVALISAAVLLRSGGSLFRGDCGFISYWVYRMSYCVMQNLRVKWVGKLKTVLGIMSGYRKKQSVFGVLW